MEEQQYFKKENEFLKFIYDTETKFLSKSQVLAKVNITPELLIEKKYKLEYCDFKLYNDGIVFTDAIFRNKSDILLYLSKKDDLESFYKIKVYFQSTQLDEVNFFIKNLLKLKNGD